MLENNIVAKKILLQMNVKKIVSEIVSANIRVEENEISSEISDLIANGLSQFVYSAANNPYLNSGASNITSSIRRVLQEKLAREGTVLNYQNAIDRNNIFYIYYWGYAKRLIKYIVINNVKLTVEELSMIDQELRNHSSAICNNYPNNKSKIQSDVLNTFNATNSIVSQAGRIDEREYNYLFANTRDYLIANLLSVIVENIDEFRKVCKNDKIDNIIFYLERMIYELTIDCIGN